jgi:hypothetical protein
VFKPSKEDAMKSFAVLALAVALAPAALAQHQTFAVKPDASEVKMTLNTTHEVVNGTFHIHSGSIEFDRSASKMSGSVVVLFGSGKTGNDSRDKRMNKDILKVEQHATVSLSRRPILALSLLQANLPSRQLGSSHSSARLTKSPSPCLSILKAQPQRPRGGRRQ